ncbi:MAG: hypothetical protein CMF31_09610 [Kordiimonas sp.]|nr:hypothetical protein [Kordiimonas sp.]
MPFKPPVARRHIHTRQIKCDGYERKDGLWDIEARMTDIKSYDFPNLWRKTIHAGEPIHEMLLRITLNNELVVQGVEAITENSPFEICPQVTAQYQLLIGLKIGPGWRRAIKQKLGGVKGCTHLTELLGPVATTAIQTIYSLLQRRSGRKDFNPTAGKNDKPSMLNSCYTWGEGSEMIRQNYPDFYVKTENSSDLNTKE